MAPDYLLSMLLVLQNHCGMDSTLSYSLLPLAIAYCLSYRQQWCLFGSAYSGRTLFRCQDKLEFLASSLARCSHELNSVELPAILIVIPISLYTSLTKMCFSQ